MKSSAESFARASFTAFCPSSVSSAELPDEEKQLAAYRSVLEELAPGVTVEEVVSKTEAELIIPEHIGCME